MISKNDYFLIFILFLITSLYLFQTLTYNEIDSNVGVVKYDGEVIMTFDLLKDYSYQVTGFNGDISFEVKDEKVMILEEKSKFNICSEQGWTDIKKIPLICLPNKIVIEATQVVDEVSR